MSLTENKTYGKWIAIARHMACTAALMLLAGCGQDTGSISLITTPPGAEIMVNGAARGTTPSNLSNLAPGQYIIELQLEGFDTAYRKVALLEKQHVNVEVKLEQTKGLLLIDSDPQGVDVRMDGISKGNTPLLMGDLPFGTYRLEFNSPTHLPRTMEAELKDRKPVLVKAELISNTATLVMGSEPEGADVLIDGVIRGTTPCTLDDVVAGTVDVKVARAGYKPFVRSMDLEATRTYEINAGLEALPSTIKVQTRPAGATVSVDGMEVGTTPLTVNVQDGSRTIEVALMGYDTVTTNMTFAPNVMEQLDLSLVKNSGTLVLDTEPASVKVYLNGELFAVTEPKGGADTISLPITLLLKADAEHTIQLVREGFVASTFTIEPELDQIITRHEALRRIFVRDTKITTKSEVIKCRLEYELPNGNMYYERFPGVFDTARAEDIIDVQPIGLDDESNAKARRQLELNRQVAPPE